MSSVYRLKPDSEALFEPLNNISKDDINFIDYWRCKCGFRWRYKVVRPSHHFFKKKLGFCPSCGRSSTFFVFVRKKYEIL